jgi:hypothetical protein
LQRVCRLQIVDSKRTSSLESSAAGDTWCALGRITYTRLDQEIDGVFRSGARTHRYVQGIFIGNELDSATRKPRGRLELDPTDLLTHGLIVGMTGSGKTGLAIDLIEEALRQGIPVLAIDPKGDLANLLLLFDRLAPEQFAAWVDPETARRQGQTPEQAGAEAAAQWTKGLASWGLAAADVADLRARHEAVIYTPGSRAGVPLGMLQSLEAPKGSFDAQEEDLRDEIAGIVAPACWPVGTRPIRSGHACAHPARARHRDGLAPGQGMRLETLDPGRGRPPRPRRAARRPFLPWAARAPMLPLNNRRVALPT